MPPANLNLNVNVRVSVSKRFIRHNEAKNVLQGKYDWNTPGLSFVGRTIARSSVNDVFKYDVILDEVPGITLTLSQGCLKYLGPVENALPIIEAPQNATGVVLNEDLLDDAIEEEDEEEDEIDLTPSDGWTAGEVYVDARLNGFADGFASSKARINLSNAQTASPLDYFLFFLPVFHFHRVIENTNIHARKTIGSWADITLNEYLMWIALLTVMTVINHSDRKAYWKQGNSHFTMSIDFSEYMSYKRFNDILRMHVFEVPSREKQVLDPLYQIRTTIEAFNSHMPNCLVPGKYLVVDESMNQWLGTGMPNVKKVPRKPHPIGQEFKTLADHHTYCILRMDTVSDPKDKEYDNDSGMRKLTATIKRLVKPWFGSGRTVIADSWFGSPEMTMMLSELGLYSIMQVTKRRYWPRGMPSTDIVEQVEGEYGSHFTMKKESSNHKLFVCAYRDQKVKAFVSSCGTTRLTGERSFIGSGGNVVTILRPEVVQEYETHKSSVDAANNLRDNMISYHDIIITERWEMRFFGFFLGLCEANAFSSYRTFANEGKISHSSFKDTLAYTLLQHCRALATNSAEEQPMAQRVLRSTNSHSYVSMSAQNSRKRLRLSCKVCMKAGRSGTRVEKSCSCNPDIPLCQTCYNHHLKQVWEGEALLNNSL